MLTKDANAFVVTRYIFFGDVRMAKMRTFSPENALTTQKYLAEGHSRVPKIDLSSPVMHMMARGKQMMLRRRVRSCPRQIILSSSWEKKTDAIVNHVITQNVVDHMITQNGEDHAYTSWWRHQMKNIFRVTGQWRGEFTGQRCCEARCAVHTCGGFEGPVKQLSHV